MPLEEAVALYSPGDGLFIHFTGAVAAAPPTQRGITLRRNGDLRAIGNSAGIGVCVAAAGEYAVFAAYGILRNGRGLLDEIRLIKHTIRKIFHDEGRHIRIKIGSPVRCCWISSAVDSV